MNLSLEVARIMHPEYAWLDRGHDAARHLNQPFISIEVFDYRTPEALGHMALWLASNHKLLCMVGERLVCMMRSDNPNKALAEAIIATQEGEG